MRVDQSNGIWWPKTLEEHRAFVRTANAHTDAVRREFGVSPPVKDTTAHVQVVYALVSGSRAGTSVLAQWVGWLYLAVVLDLCSRAVVGWSMADHMRAELVNQALLMAISQRKPAAGLLMHTDRGSQYGAESYRRLLTQHGMEASMSRKGNCWDNAVAESFLHTLKTELIYLEDFATHDHAQTAVFEYIAVFYNRQRCHSANGYLAPLAYEQVLKTNEILCPEQC